MESVDPDDPVFIARNAAAARMLRAFDAPCSEGYGRLTEIAQALFNAPIALITLLDEERQSFIAPSGTADAPRAHAFCRFTIAQTDVLIIEDATADPRVADNPNVTGAPGIRSYMGAPLLTHEDARIGTFCIADLKTRRFDADQAKLLKNLAYAATRMLEKQFAFAVAEESLRAAQTESARRARVSAQFAHDFRTPLSAILGFSEILLDAPADARTDRKRLAAIQDAARTLSVLTERYMTASAAAAGLLDVNVTSTDLMALAAEICSFLRHAATKRDVAIELDAPESVIIATDAVMIKRVLDNVLSNAVKYTRRGTTVRVALRPDADGRVTIAISDAGPGLGPEDIAELTGAHARAARLDDQETSKFGLGLSLIHDLVKRLQGEMDIEGGADGTTIALRFPAQIDRTLGQDA